MKVQNEGSHFNSRGTLIKYIFNDESQMIHEQKEYFIVPNKQVWWNEHFGRKILEKQINKLNGINDLVGIF